MSKLTAQNVPTVKLTLRVSEDLHDVYAERAVKFGRPVEDEMVRRLSDCREHTATSGVYLNDDQRNTLSQLAGFGFRNADDVLAWARKQCSLQVANVTVPLSTQLADRLRSRCFGATWEEHIRRVVTENLEREVGLR